MCAVYIYSMYTHRRHKQHKRSMNVWKGMLIFHPYSQSLLPLPLSLMKRWKEQGIYSSVSISNKAQSILCINYRTTFLITYVECSLQQFLFETEKLYFILTSKQICKIDLSFSAESLLLCHVRHLLYHYSKMTFFNNYYDHNFSITMHN